MTTARTRTATRAWGAARLLGVGALVVLLLAGCARTGTGEDESSAGDTAFDADVGDGGGDTEAVMSDEAAAMDAAGGGEAAAMDAAGGGEVASGGGTDLSTVDPAVASAGRQVISTGQIRLVVADLDRAVRQVGRLVDEVDGLIYGEDTDLRTGARTRLVVKVPPEQFRATLDELGALGDVETQSVTTDDVTDQVVDLESRIATSEASVLRLRALLAEADVVADVARIEGELLRRETDLETLRGQLRTIEDQVALATITVTLRAERTSPPPPPEQEEPQPGFMDGLTGGADALRTFAVGLSAVAGALLPWLPLLLLAAWLSRRWWSPRTRPTAGR